MSRALARALSLRSSFTNEERSSDEQTSCSSSHSSSGPSKTISSTSLPSPYSSRSSSTISRALNGKKPSEYFLASSELFGLFPSQTSVQSVPM